ncbi:MAG: adenine phosphoribosyltransferase [Calditrichae bacterium]|nr:adenine phosphoribosyltransferase [Calditrichia bacterium]
MPIEKIKQSVRDIPDFPQKGIIFKDITPILHDKDLFRISLELLAEKVKKVKPDYICGIESRGFIFGAALANILGLGFVPVRKPGKLPYDTYKKEYSLEYGTNSLEIHKDAFHKNAKVVLIDDLLATGGTAKAASWLIEQCGAKVEEIIFLIELSFLKGRSELVGYKTEAIITY